MGKEQDIPLHPQLVVVVAVAYCSFLAVERKTYTHTRAHAENTHTHTRRMIVRSASAAGEDTRSAHVHGADTVERGGT